MVPADGHGQGLRLPSRADLSLILGRPALVESPWPRRPPDGLTLFARPPPARPLFRRRNPVARGAGAGYRAVWRAGPLSLCDYEAVWQSSRSLGILPSWADLLAAPSRRRFPSTIRGHGPVR